MAAHLSGFVDLFSDPDNIRNIILEYGTWGYILFLLSFSFLQPIGIPGFVFVIASSLIWPAPIAFVLSLTGAVFSGVVGFTVSRYLARNWIASRLPARFHRFDDQLALHSIRTVILLYLVFFLAPPTHWVLGLSKVRFSAFLLGCIIGTLPGIAILTLLGSNLIEWISTYPWLAWPGLAVLVVILAYYGFLRKPNASENLKQKDNSFLDHN